MKILSTPTFTLAVCLGIFSSVQGAIIFDFTNGGIFDGTQGVGTNLTVIDTIDANLSATLTTVDVLAPEYDGSAVLTGNILSASAGDGVGTNVAGSDTMGINNPSISNSAFQTAFGPGAETTNMNPGEFWVFNFDVPVLFDSIDFASLDNADIATISVAGGPTVNFGNTNSNDIFSDPLSGFLIYPGVDISIGYGVGAIGGTTNQPGDLIRIDSFNIVAVPEPSTPSLLGLGLMSILFYRRRRRA